MQCDFSGDHHLEDAYTWEGWRDKEVRTELDYVMAPKCWKFQA